MLFALPLVILPATYGYFEYYWNNKQEDGGSKAIKPEEPALKLNEHAPVKEFIAKTEDLLRNREEAPKVVPVLKHKEENALNKSEEAPKVVPVPKNQEEHAKIEKKTEEANQGYGAKPKQSTDKINSDIKQYKEDDASSDVYEKMIKEIEYLQRHNYYEASLAVVLPRPSPAKVETPKVSEPEAKPDPASVIKIEEKKEEVPNVTESAAAKASTKPSISKENTESSISKENTESSISKKNTEPSKDKENTEPSKDKEEPPPSVSSSPPEVSAPVPTEIPAPVPEMPSPTEHIPSVIQSDDLSSVIENLRSDLLIEQSKREGVLLAKLEASFTKMINEYSPRFASSKDTPARVLSQQIDFSKSTVEELQKKYEALIYAYEDRLESLGVKNYDAFIERLRMQKRKWKERMELAHDEYLQELNHKIEERDAHWNNFLLLEQEDSEQHYEQQAKIDKKYITQETELKMTIDFEGKLREITDSLEQATSNRLKQLEEITKKIKEMEVIIVKLKSIHNMHVSIEGLQRTLNLDKGNLTQDLKVVVSESRNDEVIKSAIFKLDPFYPEMVEKGIPKIKQIRNRFDEASQRARRAALLTSKSFFNVLASMLAVKLIPKNIKTVDDADTYSVLKMTEDALDREDLREALRLIDRLQGFPREEMQGVAKDISIRLAITDLIEVLTGYTVSAVQKALTNRNY